MKKLSIRKGRFFILIGSLLLISAVVFPALAKTIQAKGIEKVGKELEVSSSEIPGLVVEKNQVEAVAENVITMTKEEEKIFDELVILLRNSTLMVSPNNRELSETESSRMMELSKEFRSGKVKCENTLAIGENLEKPYFNPENETYYYPQAEMTDKQLLQIIDFDEKINMTFAKFYEAYIQKVMDNSDIKISEEEAIQSAKDAIERIYGVDLGNMKSMCNFLVDEYNDERCWRVTFQPENMDVLMDQEKLYWMYFAKVDIYSGRVEYVDSYYSNQKEETKESSETNLNNIDEHKKIAEEVLTDRLNAKNIEFLKAYVREPNNLMPFNKNLFLVYKAEDKYVEFEFLYGSKRMVSLFYYDDLIKLNERIDKIEQESIGDINISTNVEMYDSEGNEITVYQMEEEEYLKTDFRTKKKKN